MSHRSSNARRVSAWGRDFGAVLNGEVREAESKDSRGSPGSHFDIDSWTLLVEEQRLLIARAAGVDPAKVRIKIGH